MREKDLMIERELLRNRALSEQLQQAENTIQKQCQLIDELASRIQKYGKGDEDAHSVDEYATVAEVDDVLGKSEVLLQTVMALDMDGDYSTPQTASSMRINEDLKDRLAQIEILVRRAEHMLTSDRELRLCQAIRGLCVGVKTNGIRRLVFTD